MTKIEHGTETGEQDAADHVRRYYRLIDSGEIDLLLQLFTEDAVYRRPGYRAMRGRPQLETFYRRERMIAAGAHRVGQLLVQDSQVAVSGEFAGVLKNGQLVRLKFADFFTFTADGLFSQRETFFFAPMI